jgi:hypothetical protein
MILYWIRLLKWRESFQIKISRKMLESRFDLNSR